MLGVVGHGGAGAHAPVCSRCFLPMPKGLGQWAERGVEAAVACVLLAIAFHHTVLWLFSSPQVDHDR